MISGPFFPFLEDMLTSVAEKGRVLMVVLRVFCRRKVLIVGRREDVVESIFFKGEQQRRGVVSAPLSSRRAVSVTSHVSGFKRQDLHLPEVSPGASALARRAARSCCFEKERAIAAAISCAPAYSHGMAVWDGWIEL